MTEEAKPSLSPAEDFKKAMEFYEKVQIGFGQQNIAKLTLTFPPKYPGKQQFLQEFKELDQIEQLMWCNHQLKEANSNYDSRLSDKLTSARKTILWTLMVCQQFKLKLARQYHLMTMIKHLWQYQLQARDDVKEKLKEVFESMGEYDLNKKSIVQKNKQSSSYIDSKSKKEATCGCMGNGCLIF